MIKRQTPMQWSSL